MVAPDTPASSSLSIRIGRGASESKSILENETKTVLAPSASEFSAARSGIAAASLQILELIVSDLNEYKPMELANWVHVLQPNAKVIIQVLSGGSEADLKPIHTSFLLAGLASTSERRDADGTRVITATRKVTTKVGAVPLKKTASKPQSIVTLSLDDDEGDDGLIDEDALLTDDLVAPPPALGERTAGDDCGGRKPCDDCTCGRADEWKDGKYVGSAGTEKPKEVAPPSSSCGKCGLGDAFRCASCPYLGKPAFKAGEEHLVLQLTDDL